MITLEALQGRIRTRFEQATSVRLEDERLNVAINEGVEELAEGTEYLEKSQSVSQMGGRTYYDLRGILPVTAIRPTAIWSTTTNRWLVPILLRDIRDTYRWEQSTGDARYWFMRGLFHLGVYPHSSASLGSFIVYYQAVPDELVDPGDSPDDLSRDMSNAVEEYALYELYVQEGQTDAALQHFANFGEQMQILRDSTKKRLVRARVGKIGGRA